MTDAELGRRWAAQQGRAPLRLDVHHAVRLGYKFPLGPTVCWVWTDLPAIFSCHAFAYETEAQALAALGADLVSIFRLVPPLR